MTQSWRVTESSLVFVFTDTGPGALESYLCPPTTKSAGWALPITQRLEVSLNNTTAVDSTCRLLVRSMSSLRVLV